MENNTSKMDTNIYKKIKNYRKPKWYKKTNKTYLEVYKYQEELQFPAYKKIEVDILKNRIFELKNRVERFYYIEIPSIIAILFGLYILLIPILSNIYKNKVTYKFIEDVDNLLKKSGETIDTLVDYPDAMQIYNNTLDELELYKNILITVAVVFIVILIPMLSSYFYFRKAKIHIYNNEIQIIEKVIESNDLENQNIRLNLKSGKHILEYCLKDVTELKEIN